MTRRGKTLSIASGVIFAAGFWAGFIAFIIWDQDRHGPKCS